MKRKHELIMKTPATDWRDGIPLGNGQIGAIIYGNVNDDRILLNHEKLWANGKSPKELPDVSDRIPKLRELLKTGNYEEANTFLPDAMRENGIEYSAARYQPLGNLFVKLGFDDASRNYERVLNMATGEATVSWLDGTKNYKKRLFVSRVNGSIGFQITCDQPGSINAKFTLGPQPFSEAVNQKGKPIEPTIKTSTEVVNRTLFYKGEQLSDDSPYAHKPKQFGAVANIINEGGSRKEEGECIAVDEADSVTVWIQLYVGDKNNCVKRVKELGGYEEEFSKHAKMHEALFSRMMLDLDCGDERTESNEELLLKALSGHLPTALAERMFDYGRYLLMCSSAPESMPANLQGVWNGDYMPPWSSFYMNNENVQMNYWLALPGNLRETTEAYFNYYEDRLDDFRKNARKIFGCRGINIPAFTSDYGGICCALPPHCLYWTGAAGWLAALFYDYWLFTGDKDFLKNRAIPFMREVALFYEDFFVEDEKGLFVSMPSNSPENVPPQHEVGSSGSMCGKKISVAINATMDFAIAKEVLTNLINGYASLGEKPEDIEIWKTMISKIPPYEINEDGALKEWIHPDFPDNYEHRHESHIYPVFPGFELDKNSTPVLFEACRIALNKRKAIGLKDQTGWSLAHMANARSRLGEGDKAYRALEIMAQTCVGPNLFTYHNDFRSMGSTVNFIWGKRPPFQMDANFGWTAAMLEMFVFSRPGQIHVLPALPTAWSKGKITNLCCRGGIEISIEWDINENIVNVELVSQTNQTIELICPIKGTSEKVELIAGETKKFWNAQDRESYPKYSISIK